VRLENSVIFTGFVRDITERKRLEKEILEISDRERRSIGQGLHDGLCQHLAGIELMSQVLEQNLARTSKPAAAQAGKIAQHVRDAIAQTRSLARGLSPVSLESNGLMSALQELSETISNLFRVNCRFECPEPILLTDNAVATHVYRIAQEATSNAVKHGKADSILIRLRGKPGGAELSITDDGLGFPKEKSNHSGMGLQIMKYRAGMLGAALEIRPTEACGTAIICTFKVRT
jgi:signal transduction histidine kinase